MENTVLTGSDLLDRWKINAPSLAKMILDENFPLTDSIYAYPPEELRGMFYPDIHVNSPLHPRQNRRTRWIWRKPEIACLEAIERALPRLKWELSTVLQFEARQESPAEKPKLPCAEGTKWEEIKITLLSNELVKIETPRGSGRFNYAQLGLTDRRKGDAPNKIWRCLTMFAEHQGNVSSSSSGIPFDIKENLVKNASRLNMHLQEVFGIKESIYEDISYKSAKRYKTKLFFSDATQISF